MSGIGASELWSVLRNKSQMKLEKQDDVIPVDVKVHAHAHTEPMGDLVRLSAQMCFCIVFTALHQRG